MKIKNVNDYMDIFLKKYPTVKLEDLKRIINYGWRQFYHFNSLGGDVFTLDEEGFWMYSGFLTRDSLIHLLRYAKKLSIKLRTLYARKHIQWNGYYYFALSLKLQDKVDELKHKRGRPRKNFNYGNVVLFKILDECKLHEYGNTHIYKVSMPIEYGYTIYKENYITDKAELIEIREPYKLKDILVTTKKYEYL